jgi:hypothetical protein
MTQRWEEIRGGNNMEENGKRRGGEGGKRRREMKRNRRETRRRRRRETRWRWRWRETTAARRATRGRRFEHDDKPRSANPATRRVGTTTATSPTERLGTVRGRRK